VEKGVEDSWPGELSYRRRRRGEKRGGGEGGSRAPALMFAGRRGDCCALRLRLLWLEMNAVPLS
jgi:hypothetical protein